MTLMRAVRELVEAHPDALFTRSRIAAELGLSPGERRALIGILHALVAEGSMERVGRRYRRAKEAEGFEGVFHKARGGYGFITPGGTPEGADLFVPPGRTMGAMEGDRVRAVEVWRRGQREARIREIISPSSRPLITIASRGTLLPFGGGDPLPLGGEAPPEGRVVGVYRTPPAGDGPDRKIVDLGEIGDPGTPIRVAEATYGLSEDFPLEVAAEVERIEEETSWEERRDLRSLLTVTIDPTDAKDFDDALSLSKEGRGWRLFVHIADVSHYVKPGTALDAEALRRGNSVYLPGRVYPMLPHRLSSGLCSLQPGRDRPAFTVEMTVDNRGRIGKRFLGKSVIRSDARISYKEAMELLSTPPPWKDRIVCLLEEGSAMAGALYERRLREGSLDLDLPEADLRFGLTGRVEEILPSSRLESHRIVEEAMLACNVVVAEACLQRRLPVLYRVHEEPNEEKLEALGPLLKALGLGGAGAPLSRRQTLQAVLDRSRDHRAGNLVAYLVLRAMALARYSAACLPHFGLGFDGYCHFTSPIRRYPDLVVHRALSDPPSRGGKGRGIEEIAVHCSETERIADQAERDVSRWYKLDFLQDRLGDSFPAMVLGFTRFGIRVELVDHLIEGVCPYFAMADSIDVARSGLSASGRFSGARLAVGDILPVTLARVDRVLGEAHFVPEGMESSESDRGRRPWRGKRGHPRPSRSRGNRSGGRKRSQ